MLTCIFILESDLCCIMKPKMTMEVIDFSHFFTTNHNLYFRLIGKNFLEKIG